MEYQDSEDYPWNSQRDLILHNTVASLTRMCPHIQTLENYKLIEELFTILYSGIHPGSHEISMRMNTLHGSYYILPNLIELGF